MNSNSRSSFSQVAATTVIWFFASLLVYITYDGTIVLPLASILAAAASTMFIWGSSKSSSRERSIFSSEVQFLQERLDNLEAIRGTNELKVLQERLNNLEAICSTGDFDIQQRFRQLESGRRSIDRIDYKQAASETQYQ